MFAPTHNGIGLFCKVWVSNFVMFLEESVHIYFYKKVGVSFELQ